MIDRCHCFRPVVGRQHSTQAHTRAVATRCPLMRRGIHSSNSNSSVFLLHKKDKKSFQTTFLFLIYESVGLSVDVSGTSQLIRLINDQWPGQHYSIYLIAKYIIQPKSYVCVCQMKTEYRHRIDTRRTSIRKSINGRSVTRMLLRKGYVLCFLRNQLICC